MKMFYIWITILCYFAFLSNDICVFFTQYSLRFLSLKLYFLCQIVVMPQIIVWYSLSLRNNLFILARQITAIALCTGPFTCEKLNKRDFKLLSSCF